MAGINVPANPLDLLNRVRWKITDRNLNSATIDGHKLTAEEIRILQTPVQLMPEYQILHLSNYVDAAILPVEFDTEGPLTPFQILGAIYTYYNQHYFMPEIDEMRLQRNKLMDQGGDTEVLDLILDEVGHKRKDGMLDYVYFEGIELQNDRSIVPFINGPPAAIVAAAAAATPQQRLSLTQQPYSVKSFVVRTTSMDPAVFAEITPAMDKLGGTYNARLKGGAGWIFPNGQIDRVLHYFATGEYYLKTAAPNAPAPPAAIPIGNNPQQEFGLTQQQYNEKSFVVRGYPQFYNQLASEMEKLGGLYNDRLKGGAGWIFPNAKLDRVLHYFSTGEYKLPRKP